MAFIYNLTDTWNDVTTTWNGIKLAVSDTGSSSSSKLLNLTISGSSTGSFTVDKSGNLLLSGSVNKITMTAPATGATLTLADGSTFATSGAYSSTFTFTGSTSLTFPTSGTVTALGNTTTGSGSIVLATSPTLVSPALGVPTSLGLANATGLPISTGVSGLGSDVATALGVNVGTNGSFIVRGGSLGTPSSGELSSCTGYVVGNLSGLGTGVATWLGTPSSANLAAAVTDETGSGSLVFATSPTLVTPNLGTPSAATLTNATGLPISTGVSGLGTGVATFLATPSSANLASAVTDETGSGPLVFATSPTFTSQITLGTQSTTRGSVVLANTTAGSKAVTLQSSNSTAAAYTLTLPAAAPVNGYYLQTDNLGVLSWAAGGGGGGGSPGGSNTQVQFNDAATFGGAAAFTYDKTTYTLGLGVASTSTGTFNLFNSASAYKVGIKSGNNAADWALTLPTTAGTNGQYLQTDGSGNASWTTVATGLTVGSTAISGGTSGRILYDNAGVLGEYSVIPVSLGGTNASVAGITAFNNITGYSATGATGTTSTNIVFSTSPTITTPTISGNETHTGTGALFLADFSNATVASRFAFQTSTTNGSTGIYALPNGTSTAASWQATNNATATNCSKILIATNGSTDVQLVSGINGTGTYLPLSFYTNGSQQMQLDTAGNLGLGVTPSAWASTSRAIQLAASSSLEGRTNDGSHVALYANATWNGTNFIYQNTAAASYYKQSSSVHSWYTATSGSASTAITFTQAMTLDASGNLGVGTSSPGVKTDINGLVRSTGVSISGTGVTGGTSAFAAGTISTDINWGMYFRCNTGAVSAEFAWVNGAGTERARIDSAGNLLLGGTATRATTVGAAHLDIFNGTAPAGTLTNGISLYSSSGDFNFMDSSGNGYKVGFRNIPQNAQTSAYVAVVGDVGKHISITTGGVTVNASVFSAGDVFTIYNNSGSGQTITQGTSVTMYLAGTATTGNRTLAQRGVCTVLCVASNTFVISGAGVT